MQRPPVPLAALQQIPPIYQITLYGAECDAALIRLVAVDEATPTLVSRGLERWEVCAAACYAMSLNDTKKGTNAVAA